MPTPKTRGKARYSIVIMNESGTSRQIRLTPNVIRIGVAAGVIALLLVAVGFAGLTGVFSADGRVKAERDALSKKVQELEEQLRKSDLEKKVQQSQLDAVKTPPTTVASPGGHNSDYAESASSGASGQPEVSSESALRPLPEHAESQKHEEFAPEPSVGDSKVSALQGGASEQLPSSEPSKPKSEDTGGPSLNPANAVSHMVNFDAEDVTAVQEGRGKGVIRFRLVKDRPSIRFSGYLFVFVEMVDRSGESKIYSYPKNADIGDYDMPTNPQEGETLSFKHNSIVELPFGDRRAGSRLESMAILLYGEDGNIVYQRGFGRNDIKVVKGTAGSSGDIFGKTTPRRRHAL